MKKIYLLSYFKSIIVVAVILYLSFANAKQFHGAPSFIGIDKLVHFIMYAFLSVVIYYDTHKVLKTLSAQKLFWIAFVVSTALGGLVELAQGLFFDSRSAEWGDFVFDFLGAIFASYLMFKYFKIK